MEEHPHSAERKRSSAVSASLLFRVVVGLAVVQLATPSNAQRANDIPPGAIVVIRDVPTRQAQLPGEPGRAIMVDVGPDEVLLGALSADLVPLDDEQTGRIFAPVAAPLGSNASATAGGIGSLGSQEQAQASAFGGVGQGSGAIAGAIDQSMSALSDALSTIGDVLGGPR